MRKRLISLSLPVTCLILVSCSPETLPDKGITILDPKAGDFYQIVRKMDPEERLKKLLRDTGEVNAVYGGFEIKVLKPTLFPYHKVFNRAD